jgi:hypothetical protein
VVTMKNAVLWEINTQLVQETYYISITEPSRLMLYKIWGFHGGDYQKYHLLGYKYPVHTSQETRSPLQSPAG